MRDQILLRHGGSVQCYSAICENYFVNYTNQTFTDKLGCSNQSSRGEAFIVQITRRVCETVMPPGSIKVQNYLDQLTCQVIICTLISISVPSLKFIGLHKFWKADQQTCAKSDVPLFFKEGAANLCRATIYILSETGDTKIDLMSNKMPEVKQFTLNTVLVLISAGLKLVETGKNQE